MRDGMQVAPLALSVRQCIVEPKKIMDFLDPRKKRAYKTRLIISYALMTVVIALAAWLLVQEVFGYGFNAKTRTIVQKGLLFVDSKPGGANIKLDGVAHGTTSARFNLVSGTYSLDISKNGYRDWQRKVEVDPGVVARYVYPFLFPQTPQVTDMHTYGNLPPIVTESPNHRWLLLQEPAATSGAVVFDQYDTTKPAQAATKITLPSNLLSDVKSQSGSYAAVEWSSDNNHLLLEHKYHAGTEFIIFSRTTPSASLNVNKLFKVSPTQVALRNKSTDQLYLYDAKAQTLRVAEVKNERLDPVFLNHVLAFKAYGTSLLTYVTDAGTPAAQVQARIWNNGPTYPLYTFSKGNHYLIDAAQYQGDWYYIAGSDKDDRVDIFKNPLDGLKDPSIGKALPTIALRVIGASKEAFSTNTRFVEIENGQSVGVYDFETQTRYQYSLKPALAGALRWMDGHRLIGQSDGKVFVTDYDGTNQQLLTDSSLKNGGLFSADYNHLFTLAPAAHGASILQNVDLRAGSDLPKP